MTTNAGTKTLTLEGDVPGFGSAYYDPKQAANIFGFAATVDKFDRVVYDSNIEDAFLVYDGDTVTKFPRTKEGLYAYEPKPSFFNKVAKTKQMTPIDDNEQHMSQVVATVSENMKGYTEHQNQQCQVSTKALYHPWLPNGGELQACPLPKPNQELSSDG